MGVLMPSSGHLHHLAKKQRNGTSVQCGRAIKLLFRLVGKSKDEIAEFRLGNFPARGVAG
jgi:hypothetical protein